MLQKMFGPKKEDICPNCGEACFATDTLCPRCGKNLDELFEQLPTDLPKAKPIISLTREQELFIKWVFATSISFVLGEVFLSRIAFRFVPFSLPQSRFDFFGIMLSLASGIATGLSVGFLQWLVLRNYLTLNWSWILVTFLGIASGYFIEGSLWVTARYYLSMYAVSEFWMISHWAIPFIKGLVIGSIQWVILKKLVPKSWTWVITNGLSWALAITIGEDVIRPIFYPCCFDYILSPISESIIYGVVGILIGVSTGVLLSWLLRQNSLMAQNAA